MEANIGYLAAPALQVSLLIDEISYVRRSELVSSVLFEMSCKRYAPKSLLITSNPPFREWDEIFPSSSITVAAVDRLVNHIGATR